MESGSSNISSIISKTGFAKIVMYRENDVQLLLVVLGRSALGSHAAARPFYHDAPFFESCCCALRVFRKPQRLCTRTPCQCFKLALASRHIRQTIVKGASVSQTHIACEHILRSQEHLTNGTVSQGKGLTRTRMQDMMSSLAQTPVGDPLSKLWLLRCLDDTYVIGGEGRGSRRFQLQSRIPTVSPDRSD
jgi:hypothetical protein